MRTLVILAVLGVCSAVPSIGDTPEVAAEKARFFQAFRAAEASAKPHYNAHQQAHNTGHYNPHQYNHGKYNPGHYHQPKWTGPVAATIPAGVDGTITPVSDTRDVSAARNAFFNAYQSQLAATAGRAPSPHYQGAPSYTPSYHHQPKWTGPVAATVPAGLPGSHPVVDTPEVAAAKHSFFSTYQRQAAAAAPPTRADEDQERIQYGSLLSHNNIMRTLVILAVLGVCSAVPSIGDTPEVAAEKARFFQAFRAAEASAKPHYNAHQQAHNTGHYNPHQYNHGKYNPGHYHQPKWTGPVAATIPAGVDGTITPVSDTRDVSAARNAFFNAYQSQLAATAGRAPSPHYQGAPSYTPSYHHQPKWTGPVAATVPAGLPGSHPVVDTPEVAAAKHSFFSTYQRQAAAAAPPTRYY
nr:uncharacterized protein LOC128690430 [Cherax quadricarinatus]